jgi:hypothetical protein
MTRKPDRWRRPLATLVGCALGFAFSALSWAESSQTKTGPTKAGPTTGKPVSTARARSALVASGDVPDLFLLYTGDVIGYLDPCG